jgi:hypothetical protein
MNKYFIYACVKNAFLFDNFKKAFHMKYLNKIPFYIKDRQLDVKDFEESNKIISNYIESEKAFMLCRYGFTELRVLFSSSNRLFNQLANNAGFFPADKKYLNKFREYYYEAEKNIDILLPWSYQIDFKDRERKRVAKLENITYLCDFCCSGALIGQTKNEESSKSGENRKNNWQDYQYFIQNSWFKSLSNKKILIIHPFKESIDEQYKKLTDLNILPKFKSFEVLAAVQSIGGYNDEFNNWFEALDYMKNQIKNIDFDVALIGCGAYGLPLASYVKNIGKQGLHLGGALQLLFAIKGRRWETEYNKIFTDDFWVYPKISERPAEYKKVESGCYW